MKNNMRNPRSGVVIVCLCVVVVFLWAIASYGTYVESKQDNYAVAITPASVTYGTHSTAVVPMMPTSTMHRGAAAPMISAGAVHEYAYNGHAVMPTQTVSSGNGEIYTTSSARVHHINCGGRIGERMGANYANSSSPRGISYGGSSLATPMLAMNTSRLASSTYAAESGTVVVGVGPRKAKPTGDGSPGDDVYDPDLDVTWYWDEDANGGVGDWVSNIPVGTIRDNPVTGWTEEWDGTTWVRKQDINDIGQPIGPTPWILMLLLAVGYVFLRRRKGLALRV